MAEAKGLDKPVKLKADLAELLGASSLPEHVNFLVEIILVAPIILCCFFQ